MGYILVEMAGATNVDKYTKAGVIFIDGGKFIRLVDNRLIKVPNGHHAIKMLLNGYHVEVEDSFLFNDDILYKIVLVRNQNGTIADYDIYECNIDEKEKAKLDAAYDRQPSSETMDKQGCYVATCVYGSYDCPEVWTLRRYRDETLGSSWYGRAFIRTYYAISPTLVKWFGRTKWFKKMWKGKLDKMVKELQDKGVESSPYQDKEW